jgi:hypothetical protein
LKGVVAKSPQALALAATLAAALGGALASSPARADDLLPFDPGEQLEYKLTYFGMTAGDVKVFVGEATQDGVYVWPASVTLKTRGLVNAFFSLDNKFVSYFDPAQRRGIGSDYNANDNGDKHDDSIRLRDGKAYLHLVRAGRARDEQRDVDPASHDVLSAILYLRTLGLVPGTSAQIPIFTGQKTWTLEVVCDGRERVKTDAGAFDTVHIRARTHFDGKYQSDRELEVWLTDDARRLPVKVDAPFYIATLHLNLQGWSPGLVAERRLPGNKRLQ